LLDALLFGQLLRTFPPGLLDALLFGQLLRTFLLGLPDALLFGQLLRTFALGLLNTLLFGQLLCPFLLGLPDPLLFSQLLRPLLLRLAGTLLFSELLRPLLFSQAPFFFLPDARLGFLGRALVVGQRRPELRGLPGKTLPFLRGFGTHLLLGLRAQARFVRLLALRPFALAFLGQPRAPGLCVFRIGRRVFDGLVGLGWLFRTSQRVRRRIGFHGRQRHLESAVLMRVLGNHARVKSVGDAWRR
jgi:hypothetical protein